jgi:hypothetical protein
MPERSSTMLDTAAYVEALDFARSLRAPGKPLEFPDYAEYVRLVAQRAALDLDVYEGDRHDFEELPEPYEVAYLTARLERLRDRIQRQKGIHVGEL